MRRHQNKHIAESIRYAESRGWRVEHSRGHAWGFLLCPQYGDGGERGCEVRINSTPRHPEYQARDIRKAVDRCPHGQGA
jgi:hypothetical protein